MTSIKLLENFKDDPIPLGLEALSTNGWPIVISLWYTYKDKKDILCGPTQFENSPIY